MVLDRQGAADGLTEIADLLKSGDENGTVLSSEKPGDPRQR
jgi:hypothetical protein